MIILFNYSYLILISLFSFYSILNFLKKFNIFSLCLVVSKRFGYKENAIELYAERVPFRGLSAVAQAEGLRVKLLSGLALRRYSRIPINIFISIML